MSAQPDVSFVASLEYSIEAQAYENAVLAAYVGEINYPRIVADRSLSSPYFGTTYLVGLRGGAECGRPVVVRSFDRGETWEAPRVTDVCLSGLSLDAVIDDRGSIIAAAWGPKIVRSMDSGLTWTVTADLGKASAPASLAYDAVAGTLFVAWAPIDTIDGGSSMALGGPVFVASSRDRGLSWSQPVDVLGGTTLGSSPQIVARSGAVLLGFVAMGSLPDPFVASVASTDDGLSWAAVEALSLPNPCARWSGPAVAVSPSGIFGVSWYENRASGTGPLSCWDDGGASTETWVSISRDDGRTFSGPYRAGGPPGWSTVNYLGGTLVFDDESRLFVTWHSISESGAVVYVAHSSDLKGSFEQGSFTTRFRLAAGNATGQQNLAVGADGAVYLVWRAEAFPFEAPSSGIFVRSVSGQASGDVRPGGDIPSGSPIDVELYDAATERLQTRAPWAGSTVVFAALPPTTYDVWLRLGEASVMVGTMPVVTWGVTSFTIRVQPAAGPTGTPSSWIATGIAGGILVVSAAFAALQYTRIEREDILQRKIRLLMYEFVRDHPGSSFSEVRDVMGLNNGVTSYHLAVLETQGLLHSESRRRRRWYYANGDVSLWKDLPVSPLQKSLISEIRRAPGIGVRELARSVERPASSVSDNVKGLAREGVLRTERAGRKVRCYPADSDVQP